jgi:hypothetical protein
MPHNPHNDPAVDVAKITSRRTLIGGIIAAIVTVVGSITVAIINRGCNSAPPPQMFTGRVFNKDNPSEKVRNAQVAMEGEGAPPLATTDSEGIFSFPLSNPNKEIRLRVDVQGYEAYDLRVVPAKNQGIQPIPLTPKAEATAELSGWVFAQPDQGLPDATVSLDDFPQVPPVTTSSDGVFTIRGIPKKDYAERIRVRVRKAGYEDWVEDFMLGGPQHAAEGKIRCD